MFCRENQLGRRSTVPDTLAFKTKGHFLRKLCEGNLRRNSIIADTLISFPIVLGLRKLALLRLNHDPYHVSQLICVPRRLELLLCRAHLSMVILLED